MKSVFFKPLYSTTLIASLLAGSYTAVAAPLAAAEEQADTAEQANTAALTLDQAVEKALSSNIDLELLRLEADSTFYETRLTLFEKDAIKIDSIETLAQAKTKYEGAAQARRDYTVDQAAYCKLKNNLRLQVEKAFLEAWSAKEKVELVKRLFGSSDEAPKTLDQLEANYKQALAALNELLNEKPDKEWKLLAADLTYDPLPTLEDIKKAAYEKRPDMVQAVAEKTFAQAKVNYIHDYAALSSYPGKIAQNALRKAELILAKTQKLVDQEVETNYEKVISAKKALEESKASRKEAEERYHAAVTDYHNGRASLQEVIKQEENLLETATKNIESAYQYNVAVATLHYSHGY